MGDYATWIETGSANPRTRRRLITEWSTDDPVIAKALTDLQAIPVHEPERHEAEAGLHMLQARWAWREADRLRDLRRRIIAGRQRQAVCPSCALVRSLRPDGTMRAHGRPDRCPGSYQAPAGG